MPRFATLLLVALAAAHAVPAQAPQALLTASGGGFNDQFGSAVAIQGDEAVVGAPQQGGQGAVYVFTRANGVWTQQTRLFASDGRAGDQFGLAVDIDGDRIIVGAPYHDTARGADAGAAYVFQRSATAPGGWFQEDKLALLSAIGAPQDLLGLSVAIHGSRAVVGAPNKGPTGAPNRGQAYLFLTNQASGSWGLVTSFSGVVGADTQAGDAYGSAVDITADRIMIGAPNEDSGGTDAGAVYAFRPTGGPGNSWTADGKLTATDAAAGDRFGTSVRLDEGGADLVAIGAPGVTRNGVSFSGSVYVFDRPSGLWQQRNELDEPTGAQVSFGKAVAISGPQVLVGATGAAHLFDLDVPSAPLHTVTSPQPNDFFGQAVGLNGYAPGEFDGLVGAYLDDQLTTNAGAAYVLDLDPSRAGGFFNPTAAQGDGAGWRLLSANANGFDVTDLAGQNLVQGVAGFDTQHPQQYPAAQLNVYPFYLGSNGYVGPAHAATKLQRGEGFFWYLFDQDLDGSAVPDGTSSGHELTGFSLRSTNNAPAIFDPAPSFGDQPGDDFHMLGNPYGLPLAVSGISATGGTIQGGDVFHAYDPSLPGYVTLQGTDVLAVWQGVFAELVPTAAGSAVTVNYAASARQPGTPPFYGRTGTAGGAQIAFMLTGALADGTRAGDAAALVRFRDGALSAWDALDASKLPAITASSAELAPLLARDGHAVPVSVDTRPTDAVATVPLALRTTAGGTFSLSWTDALPDGWTATLTDAVTGETLDLRTASTHAFSADGPTDWAERFALTVTPAGAVETDDAVPGGAELSTPAPNPAASVTRFQLAVGTPQAIRVTLHDALGRTVGILHDGELAGTTELSVDASRLAPGVYVVRAEGATFATTRRLTVVR